MKTILFLINGFGIEKKDSYSVYDETVMPTFDLLSKKFIFNSLDSNVKNIKDGYRNMSLEVNNLYNYGIYKRELEKGNILNNEVTLDLQKELETRKSKLHLFCFVDISLDIVDNLKSYLKVINKEQNKEIFLHLVLISNNYEDFPYIQEVLSKINIELSSLAKIGMVLGLSNLLNNASAIDMNFLLRNMITELGEKWQSFKQKLDVSYGMKSSPLSVKPFVVNSGFSVKANDLFMIWNYDNVDITNFIDGLKNIDYKEVANTIKFYSLFPITYKEKIPNILNFEKAEKSLAKNMNELNFKSLIVAKKEDINGINYYLNGMEMVNNPSITFIGMENVLYDSEKVLKIINGYDHELMIFNYDIEDVKSIEELKERLQNIDGVIKAIYDNSEKNSYSIIISSLYGMNKTLESASGEICNVMYQKVPIVYADNFITRKDYLLKDGSISDILRLCYKNINKGYKEAIILDRKNFLYRLLFK